MSIAYNTRFKKFNRFQKQTLEKEGEILLGFDSITLRGKGARDQGEKLSFIDIKEIKVNQDAEEIYFSTFSQETYLLKNFDINFQSFLKDFFKLKNAFFSENLFMKQGALIKELEGHFEFINQFGKVSQRGKAKILIYEKNILFLPETSDVFSFYFTFIKKIEYSEENYAIEIENDNGNKVIISRLGSGFEDVQEILDKAQSKMYERCVNSLNKLFYGNTIQNLLKLAYKLRDGKCVSLTEVRKIDSALSSSLLDLLTKDNQLLAEQIQYLRSIDTESNLHIGLALKDSESWDIEYKIWFICSLPSKNSFILGQIEAGTPKLNFFRIIMEKGIPEEKVPGKIQELNQCMVIFENDLTPLLADKIQLRRTKYRYAVLRLGFLRLIRRSILGPSKSQTLNDFKSEAEKFFKQAQNLRPRNFN